MNGVSRELIVGASMLVRLANPDDTSLHRALDKAQERVLHLEWEVDGDTLQIASFKTPGLQRHTDGETCDCETRRGTCWHRAAWTLLSTIAAATFGAMPMSKNAAAAAEYDDRDLTDPSRLDYPNLDVDTSLLAPPVVTPPPPPPQLGHRARMSDHELERRARIAREWSAQPDAPLTPGPRRSPTDEEQIHAIDAAGRKASKWTDDQRRAAAADLFN